MEKSTTGNYPAPALAGAYFPFTQNLTGPEMMECRGGVRIPGAFWFTVVSLVVSNWQDIRQGFSDGISGKPPRYSN